MRRPGRLAATRGRDVDEPTRTTAMHVGGGVTFQEPIGVSMSVALM